MLTIWKAVLLGAVQGATEFLPVSSSGHLVVLQQLLGWSPDNGSILAFDIALHIGTLFSVVIVFYKDIIAMLTGKNNKMIGYLVVATIPAVIVGFAFKDWFEGLYSSVFVVGVAWLVTGVVLVLTSFVKNPSRKDVGWGRSFIIGCAQACAIIPGISRSGSTIAAGLFSKIDRTEAARFAFLMSIPAIAGGAVLDIKNLTSFPSESIVAVLLGVVSAAVVGYLCIKWLLHIIKKGQLWYFGIYCLLAGIVTLIVL